MVDTDVAPSNPFDGCLSVAIAGDSLTGLLGPAAAAGFRCLPRLALDTGLPEMVDIGGGVDGSNCEVVVGSNKEALSLSLTRGDSTTFALDFGVADGLSAAVSAEELLVFLITS